MAEDNLATSAIEFATELTIAWLGNPNTRASGEEASGFLTQMHQAVQALATAGDGPTEQSGEGEQAYTPATTVRRSLASKDHIISLIDGKPYKTLRRHLSTHGLSPEEYRARYNLKPDYPMVAPTYSEARRSMAKTIGLGRKRGSESKAAPAASKSKAKAGRARATPAGE